MGYISQENLVQNMTPEQRIMIASFYAKYDVGSGIANRKIINIELLTFSSNFTVSEFSIYNINKMYISLFMLFSGKDIQNVPSFIYIYDETQGLAATLQNNIGIFNVTEKYYANNIILNNMYFSKMATIGSYIYLHFIGYRVTLI